MIWRRSWTAFIWPLWTGPRWAWSHLWPIFKEGKALHLAFVPWVFVALVLGAVWAIPKLLDASGNGLIEDPFLLAVLPFGRQSLDVTNSLDVFNFSRSIANPVWQLCALYTAMSAASFSLLGPLHVLILGISDSSHQNRASGRNHGSARWGRRADAARAGCLRQSEETDGLVLGRLGRRAGLFIARHHVITVAPTRTGKGRSCVIPTALTYPGSMFIFDPKGEVHAVTQAQRKRLQGRVARIDPFGVTQKPSHSINWLSCIDVKDRSCVSASASLANAIIARGGREDSHFDDQSQT